MKTTKRSLILILTMAGLFLSSHEIFPQQAADQLYEKALYLEEAKGEMQQAIDLYQEIIKQYPGNRPVVAKALLHAGFCYEKLGFKEAQQVYRRVINDYSENKNEVSAARVRLASLERKLADLKQKPYFRKIEIASNPPNGVMSHDGKKLAFTADNGVWVVPLQSNLGNDIAGEPVRLADVPGASNFNNVLAWSANGKWIAVNSRFKKEDFVYMIPTKEGEQRKIKMPPRDVGNSNFRLSLSPDGEKLAYAALEPGLSTQNAKYDEAHIFMIPSSGGEPRQISPGLGISPSFSPDGKLIAYVTHYEKKEPPKNVQGTRYDSDLWVVNPSGGTPIKLAVADGGLGGPVWSPDSKFLAATGRTDVGGKEIWIYPLSPDASSVGEPTIITLPGYSIGHLSGWTPENELGVFIRSEYRSAVYTVPSSGGRAVQVTPEGIVYYPRWSPDGKRIFLRWVKQDEDPPVQVVYVPAAGGNVTNIPWPETALMTRVPGGGHNISSDGRKMVVSGTEKPYNSESYVDLRVIPLDAGRPVRLTNDEEHEKYPCWSPDGKWIGFVKWQKISEDKGFDAIYRIPAEGGKPIQITSVSDSVSVGAIVFTHDGKRIAFFSQGTIKTIPVEGGESEVLIKKVKSDYWSQLGWSPDGLKIAYNSEGKIWITTLATGEKTDLKTGLPEDFNVNEFDWSPDGQKIAFMTISGDKPEFWLISNFLPLEKLTQKHEKENVNESEGIRIKLICKEPGTDFLGSVSPDGRFHAFIYWGEGDLAIRDLISGENKFLTHDADAAKGFAMTPLFSRNGMQIAYSWWNPNHTYDLFLTDVNNPSPRRLYRHEGEHVDPVFWLSDKELIFSKYTYSTKKAQVCSINILDGTIHELKTFEIQHWPRVSGSPDEKYIAYDFANGNNGGNFDINILPIDGSSEISIIKHPANDRVLGWIPGRKEFLFISDRSGTWDLWAIPVNNGKPSGPVKRIYTDIGEVEPVGFAQNGDCFVGFARRITNTLIAPFKPETGEIDEKSGESLLGSPWTVGWSPDGRFLTYDHNIRDLKTGEERKFAETLQFSHLVRWSPDGNAVLVIGRDKNKLLTEGYKGGVYAVDMKTDRVTEILRLSEYQYNTPGDDAFPLSDVQWSSDGKSIFYLFFKDRLVKHDLATSEDKILYRHSNFDRGVMKLSPDGKNLLLATKSPEEKKSRLFTIPAEGGKEKVICTAQEADNFYCAEWSPDGKYVYFAERWDGTSLWRIPAEGGIPQKTWHTKSSVNFFGFHPNGKQFALAFPESTTEVKVIKNLVQELEKLEKLH